MERAVVTDVLVQRADAAVAVTGVPDHPGAAAAVFGVLAELGARPGLAVQHAARAGRADLTVTLPRPLAGRVHRALAARRGRIGFTDVRLDLQVAVVVLRGAGMRTDPVVPATFAEAMAHARVPLGVVAIDANRICLLCAESEVDAAVRALREAFEVGLAQAAPAVPAPRDHVVPQQVPQG